MRAAFEPDAPLFPAGRAFYRAVEQAPRPSGRRRTRLEQAAKVPLFGCRDCGDCSLPEIAYVCPESQCAKNQRNGPCGGTREGLCEVYDTECIWSQAYERLKAYGEEESMLDGPVVVKDNALHGTSAWANTFLGRDHTTRDGSSPGIASRYLRLPDISGAETRARGEHGARTRIRWTTVKVDVDDGIAWVELNRPEKRNAMSPTLNAEMVEVLETLDADDDCQVLVLTGAGDSLSAGMDLKEYFREVDEAPEHVAAAGAPRRGVLAVAAAAHLRRSRRSRWSTAGASAAPSRPLVACDLAIAADEATFGLSEINWGIPPGSVVSKALADTVGSRAGLLYVMTGRTFDGQQAAEMGLVNSSVPLAQLRARGRARSRASCSARTRSCCARRSSATSTAAR